MRSTTSSGVSRGKRRTWRRVKPVKILSLGAGRQSSAIFAMACYDQIERFDCAVFADTGWEPAPVYAWLNLLKEMGKEHGIPIHTVQQGNIRDDALVSHVRGVAKDGKRWSSMPLFVKKIWTRPELYMLLAILAEKEGKGQKTESTVKLIAQVKKDGTAIQRGMIRRQCTYEYKIRPIEKAQRALAGYKPRKRMPPGTIECWKGISMEEAGRSSVSKKKWVTFYYPLIEMRMRASDCIAWFKKHHLPEPPRSACVGCPFRHNTEWEWLRDNSPKDFEDAVFVDKAIRKCGGMRGDVFLHADRIPLSEVNFEKDKSQRSLWGEECAGVCGV